MSAQHEIAKLDRALATRGQPVVFRRDDFDTGRQDIPVRAFLKGFDPTELVGGVDLNTSHATLSPSDFASSGLVPQKGDSIIAGGRTQYVDNAEIRRIGDQAVRFELTVTG
ncbi:hypothetical protein [Jiella sp. M17.18]|uniref:hypothetical protein n=1 Tax=Jiella sp. M17.18 TaxID=3234247 RepID=UPI0034DE2971